MKLKDQDSIKNVLIIFSRLSKIYKIIRYRMDLVEKLKQIIRIQNDICDEKIGELNGPVKEQQITQIEKLLGEPLADEFRTLYSYADGQIESGKGVLFGHRFVSSKEVVSQLEFSLTLVKPVIKKIENEKKSEELIKEIIAFYRSKAPKKILWSFKKGWYKIEFDCGIGSYGGPYIYFDENTTPGKREIFNIDFDSYETIAGTIKELHELEKETYNWDKLEFVIYGNGKYEVERTFFDFDNQIPFTSTPENAIKKKYFHYKWVPLFSDYGGNYIGIDCDPDINGKKGQIINFGRDEEKMVVLADGLEQLFDLVLSELKKTGSKLCNTEFHLHDVLREIRT